MDSYMQKLMFGLSSSVAKSLENAEEIGILFSGGLDSSLIAHLVKNAEKGVKARLYTVGTSQSLDLKNAQIASRLLGMELMASEITQRDIIRTVPELSEIIKTRHPVKITFELPLFLCLAEVKEAVVLGGQGADELFGGYARYLRMNENELKAALKKDTQELIDFDIKMDLNLAKHFGKTLNTPYLEKEIISLAQEIPIEKKVKNGQRKIILRDAAVELGLPRKIAFAEKKAVQYSSGIIKELRKVAKGEGMKVNEIIEHLLG